MIKLKRENAETRVMRTRVRDLEANMKSFDIKCETSHKNFKNEMVETRRINFQKALSWDQVLMIPALADISKLTLWAFESDIFSKSRTWWDKNRVHSKWLQKVFVIASASWTLVNEIHLILATNPARTTLEVIYLKINALSRQLSSIDLTHTSKYKKLSKIMEKLPQAVKLNELQNLLNMLSVENVDFLKLNFDANRLENFKDNKLDARETWSSIKFRLPIGNSGENYLSQFPENELETLGDSEFETAPSENIQGEFSDDDFSDGVDTDFTSSLPSDSVNYVKPTFSSFMEELDKYT